MDNITASSRDTIELLREIRDNTKGKQGFDIIVSGKTTTFTNDFSPSIDLKGNWGIALDNLSTFNAIQNVTSENNRLDYYNGTSWVVFTLKPGAYEIDEINEELKQHMQLNGDYDTVNDRSFITITASKSRLTAVIEVIAPYKVSFNTQVSNIGPILGFDQSVQLTPGINESPNPVNIINVNSVTVNCNLTQSSYINGIKANSIYSFPIEVSPGFRMVTHPNSLQFHKIVTDKISSIRIWLTDDNGKALYLNNELVTMRLRIQEL